MKKNAVYWTRFFTATAFIGIITATFLRIAKSWSQMHMGKYDYLLYAILIPITSIFLIRSMMHPKGGDRLFWIIRNRHLNAAVAVAFMLVAIFGVNSEIEWVAYTHLIVTGIAIGLSHTNMIAYYDEGIQLNGAIVGSCVGILGFLFAFITPFLTTGEGELIAAIPILIWVLSTTKIEKDD